MRRSRRLHEWLMVCVVAGVVVFFNVVACGMFIWKLSRPALIVDGMMTGVVWVPTNSPRSTVRRSLAADHGAVVRISAGGAA